MCCYINVWDAHISGIVSVDIQTISEMWMWFYLLDNICAGVLLFWEGIIKLSDFVTKKWIKWTPDFVCLIWVPLSDTVLITCLAQSFWHQPFFFSLFIYLINLYLVRTKRGGDTSWYAMVCNKQLAYFNCY